MNRYITIRTGLVALAVVTIVAVALSVWNFTRQENKYAVTEQKTPDKEIVSVDFSRYPDTFTRAQELQIQTQLLKGSTKKVAEGTKVNGTIRDSSFMRPSEREVFMIIDSPELQTSYAVSRFVNPDENLDILNVVCVEESQRIYKKDYCFAE